MSVGALLISSMARGPLAMTSQWSSMAILNTPPLYCQKWSININQTIKVAAACEPYRILLV